MNSGVAFFNTKKSTYLYDGNTGKIWSISPLIQSIIEKYSDKSYAETIEVLGNKYSEDEIEAAMKHIDEAKKKGLLSPYPERIFVEGMVNELQYDLENNISGVCLSVTQSCNLRCEYCVYSGQYENERLHSDSMMSFETAKKAIDYTISKSCDTETFYISFYGGEPLLRFNLIRQCIEYVSEKYQGKEIKYNMTSNGTLLKGDILKYFVEHNVLVHISLDGPEEYHDEYRKFANGEGTFGVIRENILNIRQNYPEYYKRCISFGMTLSPYRSLQVIDSFFSDNDIIGEKIRCRISRVNNAEGLSIYTDKKSKEVIDEGMTQNLFIDTRYLHARIRGNIEHLRKARFETNFNENVERLNDYRVLKDASADILPGGCCIPGTSKLYVATNGDFYVCEKCSETADTLKIGNVDTGIDAVKAEKIIRDFYSCEADECLKCWAFMYCSNCPVQLEAEDGFSSEEKLRRCKNVMRTLKRSMAYYTTILEKNPNAFGLKI